MKPKPPAVPWQLIIRLLTLAGIAYIYQSPRIDNAAILALIGCACMLMGLLSLRTARREGKPLRQHVLQCGMGAVILGLGIVETLPQAFWYAVFALILLLLLGFTWFRKKKK